VAEFAVDVTASRARQEPVLWLRSIGPFEGGAFGERALPPIR